MIARFFRWYIPIYEKHWKRSFYGDVAQFVAIGIFVGLIMAGFKIHAWVTR